MDFFISHYYNNCAVELLVAVQKLERGARELQTQGCEREALRVMVQHARIYWGLAHGGRELCAERVHEHLVQVCAHNSRPLSAN